MPSLMSKAVPMKLRLRKYMGIYRLNHNQSFICGGIDYFEMNPTKSAYQYSPNDNSV